MSRKDSLADRVRVDSRGQFYFALYDEPGGRRTAEDCLSVVQSMIFFRFCDSDRGMLWWVFLLQAAFSSCLSPACVPKVRRAITLHDFICRCRTTLVTNITLNVPKRPRRLHYRWRSSCRVECTLKLVDDLILRCLMSQMVAVHRWVVCQWSRALFCDPDVCSGELLNRTFSLPMRLIFCT